MFLSTYVPQNLCSLVLMLPNTNVPQNLYFLVLILLSTYILESKTSGESFVEKKYLND